MQLRELVLGLPLHFSPGPPVLWFFSELTAAPSWLTSFPVTLTSRRVHAARHGPLLPYNVSGEPTLSTAQALSHCFFYAKPFLTSVSPALIKHTLEITWTHLVTSFLYKTPHTGCLRQTYSNPGPCPVTLLL